MKERPILFSAPMVRALLAGTKTQTRRVVRPMPQMVTDHATAPWEGDPAALLRLLTTAGRRCPYGQPGDRLWVRETHAPQPDCLLAWEKWLKGAGGEKPIIHYAADASESAWVDKRRPSIHMPRWASRLLLEVTGVRVERLQDISETDAIAEGLAELDDGRWLPGPCDHPEWAYHLLWEQINGPGSWAANPWVWVVEFRRITP